MPAPDLFEATQSMAPFALLSGALKALALKPLDVYEANKGKTTQEDVNPNYILPKMFMMRLQKLMDEYAGGVGLVDH